jgi:hypothetical protein
LRLSLAAHGDHVIREIPEWDVEENAFHGRLVDLKGVSLV